MMGTKKILQIAGILVSLLFVSVNLSAQRIEVGVPPSFNNMPVGKTKLMRKVQVLEKHFKVEDLKKEDVVTNKMGMPLRIAEDVAADVDINRTGEWMVLSNGQQIWQQTIQSPDANGLILSFDEMYIPQGAKLYIYTSDRLQVEGAYTEKTNPSGGEYSSPVLFQDEVTLEYVASAQSEEAPRIKISSVGYVYNMKAELAKEDLSCMVNINCEEGDNWQKQKKGVVGLQIRIGSSSYVCSGVLVNNARKDKTPYIMTADHCIWVEKDTANFATMMFDFYKEKNGCTSIENIISSNTRTLVGAELLVDIPLHKGSDGVLLKLKNEIPSDWNVYYNGWDAREIAPSSGVGIHHPGGYQKTVSTYKETVGQTGFGGVWMSDTIYTASFAHWSVLWSKTANGRSVTAGGSSGSPLFNQDGLVVGTLTGGNSECGNLFGEDVYGKMSYHWNKYSGSNRRMKTYLDPDDTGILVLEGLEVNKDSGIASEKAESSNVVIFPNPVNTELHINAKNIISKVWVYDISGRLVTQQSGDGASTLSMSTESWQQGVYQVLVETGVAVYKEKIIK
ncbi:serine protease [Dysgonomonas sp. 520]|uniref:trypsin-like serine peptidase n=1 Tax=Dysgonomonas sp. 520 TaxID=2302931 RepID=UPI0013D85CCB|nr:T9SS type A sorting domain-containing protein [Dysgonomonas sp. 520]NDW09807.1 T9SS C-terminal target domain-containing protein [Dysgonomonas sp. 520]